MDEPQPDPTDGFVDAAMLDRSQQAARFLDLARHHGLDDHDDDADVLAPIDGDVFGDGNGFSSGTGFGSDAH